VTARSAASGDQGVDDKGAFISEDEAGVRDTSFAVALQERDHTVPDLLDRLFRPGAHRGL
jgi:hypothetical protein